MERKEVINPGLGIWIVEYNLHKPSPPVWKADGVGIDGFHGFGDENTRSFNGKVSLYSGEKVIRDVSIWLSHFSRQGLKWILEGGQSLPEPPFLISGTEVSMIFDGEVEISGDEEVVDYSATDDYTYPIGTRDWFGVMKVKKTQKMHLTAFSIKKDVMVSKEDKLWSFEWDCPAGRIETVKSFN